MDDSASGPNGSDPSFSAAVPKTANPAPNDTSEDRLEVVMEDFMAQLRTGRTPSLSSYAEANPDIATEIKELLPLISMVEGAGKSEAKSSQKMPTTTPATIGEYRIVREIGRGGMGIVYEAEQKSPKRRVALKLLPFSNDATARERFRREAEAAAALQHPNVIPVFEVGTSGHATSGLIFYTMQFIDGYGLDTIRREIGSLRSSVAGADSYTDLAKLVLSSKRLPHKADEWQSSKRDHSLSRRSSLTIYYHNMALIVAQAADAIEHAHRKSIIHRDVKPSNILVDRTGHVWVSDFGLAKYQDDELTRTGDIVGSVRYMSPERFSGRCDERADIYALGISLYELLTLDTPFSSPDKLQIIKQVCEREPTPPRQIDQRIPLDLETIVLKAIDKNPERRYATCEQLAIDLRRFLNDKPIHARRLSRTEKSIRWARKNRLLSASILTTIVACIVAITGLTFLATTREQARKNAIELRNKAEDARRFAEAQSLTNERNLYFSQMNFANQSLESESGISRAREILHEWNPSKHSNIDFGWEWDYIQKMTHPELLVLTAVQSHAWNPTSPTATLAFARKDTIYVRQIGEATNRYAHALDDEVVALAWLDETTLICGTQGDDVIYLDVASGDKKLIHHFESSLTGVSLNAERSMIAVATSKSCTILDVETKATTMQVASNGVTHDWHPTKNRLLISSSPYTYTIVDVDREAIAPVNSTAVVNVLRWDHAGEKVLIGGNVGDVAVADAEAPTEQTSNRLHRHYVHALETTPINDQDDNRMVASGGGDRLVKFWSLEDPTPKFVLMGAGDYIEEIQFAANGSVVSAKCQDGTLHVWKTPPGVLRYMEPRSTWAGCQHAIAVHPNCQDAAWVNFEGITLQGLQDNGEKMTIPLVLDHQSLERSCINAIAWSPDGKRFAWCNQIEFGIAQSGAGILTNLTLHDTEFAIFAFDWSPDGSQIARGGSHGFEVWDPETQASIFRVVEENNKIKAIEYSPDGKWIAIGSYKKVRVYRTSSMELAIALNSTGKTTRVSFSPDGTRLAAASGSGFVELFSIPDGERLGVLRGHIQDVFSVDWHPQGNRIATGSSDGTVRVWDADSMQQVLAFAPESTPILSVEWSKDGSTLTSVAADNGLTIRSTKP